MDGGLFSGSSDSAACGSLPLAPKFKSELGNLELLVALEDFSSNSERFDHESGISPVCGEEISGDSGSVGWIGVGKLSSGNCEGARGERLNATGMSWELVDDGSVNSDTSPDTRKSDC
jgi:hypothetical protein